MWIMEEWAKRHLCCSRQKSWGGEKRRKESKKETDRGREKALLPMVPFSILSQLSLSLWPSPLKFDGWPTAARKSSVHAVRIGLNEISVKTGTSIQAMGCHWHIIHRPGPQFCPRRAQKSRIACAPLHRSYEETMDVKRACMTSLAMMAHMGL